MPDLRELQRKLDSVKALREIVNAMRNLAAIYVRRAQATLDAIRPYTEVVQTCLGFVLDRCPAAAAAPGPGGRCLALVFASDQGLCGTYNDHVVQAAMKFSSTATGPVDFVAIGNRARSLLESHGEPPVLSTSAPTSLEGIRLQVVELAADVFHAYVERGSEEMVFIYNAYEGMGRFRENVRHVLPPGQDELGRNEGTFRTEPILTDSPAELLGAFIEEYFFIELYRALLESHTSENGARLLSMTAAASNIEERVTGLTQQFQSVRQDAITSELLDVVGGAEALQQGP